MNSIDFVNIGISTILLYSTIISIVYGIQPSLSQSFYTTDKRPYFTLTLMTTSFLLMIGLAPNWWFVLGSFCLGIVGVAANYKWEKWIAKGIHFTFVILAILLFIIGFTIINKYIGITLLFAIVIPTLILRNIKNSLFWIEMMIIIVIATYINVFKTLL